MVDPRSFLTGLRNVLEENVHLVICLLSRLICNIFFCSRDDSFANILLSCYNSYFETTPPYVAPLARIYTTAEQMRRFEFYSPRRDFI